MNQSTCLYGAQTVRFRGSRPSADGTGYVMDIDIIGVNGHVSMLVFGDKPITIKMEDCSNEQAG